MGSDLVVIVSPSVNQHSGVQQVLEDMGVETLVPELTVETLDVRVLDRLSGPDELQGHSFLIGPLVERLAGKLRAVIDGDGLGKAPGGRQFVQGANDPRTGQREVDLDCQAGTC